MSAQRGWEALHPASIVDVIAPGMAVTSETIELSVQFLKAWGLEARLPAKLLGRDVLCSNSDRARFEHLSSALAAEDSSVIWCLRGGYGSIRLLPALERCPKPRQTKLIVGLSDVTSLHLFFNQRWGWPSLHGSHLDRLATQKNPQRVVRELRQILFNKIKTVEFKRLRPLNSAAQRKFALKSRLTGGNLVTVQSTIGTPFEIKTSGRILFLEDLGERGYRIDRCLEHLRQAGLIDLAQAVVFGTFTGGLEPDGRWLAPKVLKRFAESLEIPVFSGLPCGHDYVQRPLPLNTQAELRADGRAGSLVCATGVWG